jgi:serine/threonine protein kinase
MKFAFQTPEKLFLLLDYAAGGNMSRALHKDRRFTEERARMYLSEILLAIEDLHKRDIIYRDLKPDNIVFDS